MVFVIDDDAFTAHASASGVRVPAGFTAVVPSEEGRSCTALLGVQRTICCHSCAVTDQLTRALGEAVIRIWSDLPHEVQDRLFQEAVASQGESIRSQLAVVLHDQHERTSDPLGDPREKKEPDSLGG
jgi:hypothetical protein